MFQKIATITTLTVACPLLLAAASLYSGGQCRLDSKGKVVLIPYKTEFNIAFVALGLSAGCLAVTNTLEAMKSDKNSHPNPSHLPAPTAPNLGAQTTSEEDEATKSFYTWEQLPKEATGIFIAGDPGSGKTALASWLLGLCTEVCGASQIIIFDTHNHEGKWPNEALILDEEEQILITMRWLLDTELGGRHIRF